MPATGSADNAITFSFDSPNALPAEAELQAAVANTENPDFQAAAPVAKPAAEVPPVVETKPAEAKVEAKVEAAQADPDELKTYKITVDGQELEVTEHDLKAGHMRQRDYTQKTQQLAEQRRAWETERTQYQSELQALDAFLKDKTAVAAYAKQAHGIDLAAVPTLPVPQIDTTQPLTAQDVAKIAAYNAEQVRLSMAREFEDKLAAARKEASDKVAQGELNTQRKELASDLEGHVSRELTRFPILKKFEGIEEELIADAHRRLPQNATVADAKAQITAAVERRIAVIKSLTDDDKKQSAIKAAELKRTSPEPPGGAPITSREGRKLTLKDSDRKDFLKGAEEDLRTFMAANN